jgi:hypothetical protein
MLNYSLDCPGRYVKTWGRASCRTPFPDFLKLSLPGSVHPRDQIPSVSVVHTEHAPGPSLPCATLNPCSFLPRYVPKHFLVKILYPNYCGGATGRFAAPRSQTQRM